MAVGLGGVRTLPTQKSMCVWGGGRWGGGRTLPTQKSMCVCVWGGGVRVVVVGGEVVHYQRRSRRVCGGGEGVGCEGWGGGSYITNAEDGSAQCDHGCLKYKNHAHFEMSH